MARRFFVDEKDVLNSKIVITGNTHNHISKVLRMQKQDKISVSSFKFEFECEIEEILKDKTICKILSKKETKNNLKPVTLFQAVMKNEHMDFLVQKVTELNIKSFVPFLSEFVVVKPDNKKIERFKRISVEACKQSGRTSFLEINEVLNFSQMLEKLKGFKQVVVAYEKDKTPAKEVLKTLDKSKETAIIVGSEGGFSEKEIEKLKAVGAKTISLGKNILRGETAGVVLSSLVLYEFDEFKGD